MTKQYAKVRIDYNDYLIDLSDVQPFLNIMSKATKLFNRYDSAAEKYVTYRDGKIDCVITIATGEEINAPVYVKLEGE
jgi:hypothetical protein